MSNIWILLIQLASLLLCASNPTEDFDAEHLNVLKEVHKIIKNEHHEKYCQVTKEMHLLTTKFIVEFCGVHEHDNINVCDEGRVVKQYNAIKAIKEHIEFATVAWDHDDPIVLNAFNKIRTIYCDKMIEAGHYDEDDESRIDLHELYGVLKKEVIKVLHNFSNLGNYIRKRGEKLLSQNLVQFTGPSCLGAECKICVTFIIPDRNEVCMKMRYSTESDTHKLLFSVTNNGKGEFTKTISMDELAYCLVPFGFLGHICIEIITNKNTEHYSSPHRNFCIVLLADKIGVGLKVCASYKDGEFKINFMPRLFAGARSENNTNILEVHSNGENGVRLDASEFDSWI